MRKVVGVLLLALVLVLTPLAVAAQDPEPPVPVDPGQIPELPDFLETLAGPGGWLALGAFLSMALAKWPWFNGLDSLSKRAIVIGATIVLSVAARVLVQVVPVGVWELVADYWFILYGVILTYLGSQVWYRLGVKPKALPF